MNYVPNQNEKVLFETLAGFNLDDVKSETSTLFQNDPLSFVCSSRILFHSFVTLSRAIESITNSSVG